MRQRPTTSRTTILLSCLPVAILFLTHTSTLVQSSSPSLSTLPTASQSLINPRNRKRQQKRSLHRISSALKNPSGRSSDIMCAKPSQDQLTSAEEMRGGAASSVSRFTKVRETIFPIHGSYEWRKFLSIGLIKFFIIVALTLTRDTKDTLIVTQCGAEAIAFLKIYGVLPAATAFIALYSNMASTLDKKTLFYTTCIPFFVFFFLFDMIIYPNRAHIQPSLSTVQSLMGATAGGGSDIIAKIICNWTSALFYITSEIYSSVSVGLLFWQFANDVVSVDQAKRFYPLFAQMSALGPIFAGQYVVRFSSKSKDFATSLHRLTMAITVSGIMICVCYYMSNKFLENNPDPSISAAPVISPTKKKTKKPKLSMVESAKFLASSKYLRLLTTLVLGYGLTINFTEITWKSLLKKKYPDPLDYQRFTGNFSTAVGTSTCIIIFFGVHVIRILGWRVGAIATPTVMAILGIPFFSCIFFGLDSPASLNLAVVIGTVQSLLSKTFKYALFDPTTQMAYIPLDEESKVKGKAAIEVLGSRIGKSGGSLIQQLLVIMLGNILNAAPVVAVLFYGVLIAWASAAYKLGGMFTEMTEKQRLDSVKKEA